MKRAIIYLSQLLPLHSWTHHNFSKKPLTSKRDVIQTALLSLYSNSSSTLHNMPQSGRTSARGQRNALNPITNMMGWRAPPRGNRVLFCALSLSLSLIRLMLTISSNKSKHSCQNILFYSKYFSIDTKQRCVCGYKGENGVHCKMEFQQPFSDITNKNDKSFAAQCCNCLATAESFWLSSSPLTSCFRATRLNQFFHSAVAIENLCTNTGQFTKWISVINTALFILATIRS